MPRIFDAFGSLQTTKSEQNSESRSLPLSRELKARAAAKCVGPKDRPFRLGVRVWPAARWSPMTLLPLGSCSWCPALGVAISVRSYSRVPWSRRCRTGPATRAPGPGRPPRAEPEAHRQEVRLRDRTRSCQGSATPATVRRSSHYLGCYEIR